MASFVEEATLRLNDEASKNAAKINASMEKLEKTAKSLKASLSGWRTDMSGIASGVNVAVGDLKRLRTEAASLKSTLSSLRLSVGKINTTQAHQSIATLIKSAQLIEGQNKLTINTSDLDYAITRTRSLITDLNQLRTTYRINIDASAITNASTDLRTLHGLLGQSMAAQTIQVNATQLQQALRQLQQLRNASGAPINLTGRVNLQGIRRAISDGFGDGLRDLRQNLGLTFDQASQRAITSGLDVSKGETDLRIKFGLGSQAVVDQLKVLASQGQQQFQDVSTGAIMRTFGDVLPNMKTAQDAFDAARDIPRQLAIFNQKYGPSTEQAQNAAVEFNKALVLLRAIGTDARSTAIRDRLLQQSLLSGQDVTEAQVKRWMQGIPTAMLQKMNAEMVTTLISGGEEQQQRYIQGARMLWEGLTNNNIAEQFMTAQKNAGIRDDSGLVTDSKLLAEDQFAWVEKNLRPIIEKDLNKVGKTLNQSADNAANAVEVQNALGQYFTASRSRLAAAYLTEADFIKSERRKVQRVNLDLAATNDSLAKSMLRVQASFETMTGTAITKFQPEIADASKIAANAMTKLTLGQDLTSTEIAAAASVALATAGVAALSSNDPVAKAMGAAATVIGIAGYMMKDAASSLIDGIARLTGTQTPEQIARDDRNRQLADLNEQLKTATDAEKISINQRIADIKQTELTQRLLEKQQALADAAKMQVEIDKQQKLAESKQGYTDQFLTDYFGRFTDKSPAETADIISKQLGNISDGQIGSDDLRALQVKTIQELQKRLGVTADGKIGEQTIAAIQRSGWIKKIIEQAATVKSQTDVATMTTDRIKPVVKADNVQVDVGGRAAIANAQTRAAATKVTATAPTGAETSIMQTVVQGAAAFTALLTGGIAGINTAAAAATSAIDSEIGTAGGTIASALSTGASTVAAAIRSALSSTPVNVNVNTNGGGKPVDTGINTFAHR